MQKKSEEKTLEQLIDELNDILEKLEDQDLPLEEAVELFSKGADLNKRAREKLNSLEERIKVIKEGLAKEDYSEEEL